MITTLERQDIRFTRNVGGQRIPVIMEAYRLMDVGRDVGAVEANEGKYRVWVGGKYLGDFDSPEIAHDEADKEYQRQLALSRLTRIIEGE